jgi:diaminopimelate epimerase
LSPKATLRVETMSSLIELTLQTDGRVAVDMGAPIFDLARVPFDAAGLVPRDLHGWPLWPIDVDGRAVEAAVLSMGNPHAVMDVRQFGVVDVDDAPVAALGPRIETHARFPRKVNAGFVQVVSRNRIRLRVHERGAGETLACGTGACAAVVAGIRQGWLDARVDVDTRGGRLTIEWPNAAGSDAHVTMTGPAETVFEGEIEL